MSEEKRRESAGRVASAIALPEWSLRRKMALALTIPMLLAATFGGLRVHTELAQSDNYSATAKQITVLRPAAGYLAAAERAIIVSRQRPALDDPGRASAIQAVEIAGKRLKDIGQQADLTATQRTSLDNVLDLSSQLRDGKAYVSSGQAVSQVRQLQRSVTELIDAIVAAQIKPEPKLGALQQALDGRVSLAMQQYMVNVPDPKSINLVDLSAELGVEQVIIDRLGSYLGTTDKQVSALNKQNATHFGVVRDGGHDLGDAEAFETYDNLSVDLLNDIDKGLTSDANDARGLAIANAVITVALLLAAIFLALFVSRMLLNPIRRVREGALEVANTRLPEMVAKIRAGEDPGEITPIPVDTHEEMGQLARAVDDLHRQAVHLASGEAQLRAQVGDMFSTLSRRNTSLINQQLGLIERLEKDEKDPNRLESLFRLDHLASRMRRTADSLMVLADAPTQTSDTDTLALGDVFQAAMAGVQEYQRVQIQTAPADKVNGSASADVVHLMTELVDNALAFSPPTAPVTISTKQAGDSIIVEISDGGLGIAQDVLTSLNEGLRSGGEVTVETARRMGLLVVSRLAKRHGITVSLARNARGGTTATVLLPPALLRGTAAQPQPRQRPGLAGLTPAKSVLPAQVTERLSSEHEPKLPTRLTPVAPVEAPAAAAPASALAAFTNPGAPSTPVAPAEPVEVVPAAAAVPAAADTESKQPPSEVGVDSISAAINAVTRLPQRSPGATRSGSVVPGSAPVSSGGGSLFQRLQASGNGRDVAKAGLPQREPGTPTLAFDAIEESSRTDVAETSRAEAAEVEAPPVTPAPFDIRAAALGLDVAKAPEPVTTVEEREAEQENDEPADEVHEVEAAAEADDADHADELDVLDDEPADDTLAGAVTANSAVTSVDHEDAVAEAVSLDLAPASPVALHQAAEAQAVDLLDSRTPVPESAEDDSPIFRALRSNWFTAGESEGTWTTSEIEAGWEAAEQVAEAPALQLTESGLPMRRPGKRLVPGGVSPAPAKVDRDPEAIRARLAAHAAGVTRGRTRAVDETVTAPNTEEGPA